MQKYDVIIIGAGLSGLISSCYLSKNEKKVLLVEKNIKTGGFATSFQIRDFKFDVSLHNFGSFFENKNIIKILTELEIIDKIEFIPFKDSHLTIFPEYKIKSVKGLENFYNELKKFFPDEEKGLKKLFKVFTKIYEEYSEIDESDALINKITEKFTMFPIMFPTIVFLSDKTLSNFLSDYIKNEKLKGIISNLWWLFGVPDSELASIFYPIPLYSYYEHCGGLISGTSEHLSNAIAKSVADSGGEIILNSKVKKILTENRFVQGVLLESGEKFFADKIISSISSYETLVNLTSDTEIDKEYRRKILESKPSVSAFQIYLGLNIPTEKLGFNANSVTNFESYDHKENYEYIKNGNYEKIFFSITNYSLIDKTVCHKNKGLINILTLDWYNNWENLSEEEIKSKEKEISGILIKRVEKIIPDLAKHIEILKIASPPVFKNFSGNFFGSIYGNSQILNQSGIERLSSGTPIKGLFIAGADIFPGAGYQSVISSGYKVAKYILENEKS